jgi:hypothetical protein
MRTKAALYKVTSGVGVAVSAGLVFATPSCTLIENHFRGQCETTQDCVDLANRQPRLPDGGPSVSGLVCTDQHVCEPESGCHSNLECQVAHGGAGSPYICRHSDRSCQSLVLESPDGGDNVCEVLADPGDYQNENTIWLGAAVFFKQGSYQGLEMARQDFNQLASGLPPATAGGMARRPLAFVYCDGETIDVSGAHLVNDLDLPVVITSIDTTSEIELLTKYSMANGKHVFQLSTTAAGQLIKTVDGQGHLIDMALIDENYDKESMGVVKNYYVPALRSAGTLSATELPRVAVVHSSTPTYANTSAKVVTAIQGANTASMVQDFGYGESDNPTGTPAEYASVVSKVLAFKPHVIIMLGDNEISSVDVPIEMGWAAAAAGQPAPQWLGLLGAVAELPIDIASESSSAALEWAGRSLFIQQHFDFKGKLFTDYFAQLKQLFPGDPEGIYEAEQTDPYNEFLREATYLTSYSIALLAGQGKPVNGTNVAEAARTFGAKNQTTITIGKDNIFPGLQAAATGNPFNLLTFQGWTGFDANGFATYALTDDVYCLSSATGDDGGTTLGGLQPTGAEYDNMATFLNSVSLTGCAGH